MAHQAARALLLLACAAGAIAPVAAAQPRSDLARVERQRNDAQAQAARLRREAQRAQRDLRALTARARETQERRSELVLANQTARERLEALKAQEAVDRAALEKDRATLENLLIAAAFAERRHEQASVRARMFTVAAAPSVGARLRARQLALANGRAAQDTTNSELITLAQARLIAEADAAGAEMRLAQQRAVHNALRADAAEADRRARTLAREARTLRELASRVTQPRRAAGAAGASAALPASWLAPTSGRIVRSYGAREGAGAPAQGATLRAASGASVIAPAAGEVAYAGMFRSYGQVLILNLDNGYALVLTGMETLRARTGERVVAGQAIGVMSSSDTSAPDLYVEVRRNGQPVDPARWLTARGVALASAG